MSGPQGPFDPSQPGEPPIDERLDLDDLLAEAKALS